MVSRFPPLVLVLGVGEISSAVAHRLFKARFRVVMTENDFDCELRRYTSFSRVFAEGRCEVEGVGARSAVVTETASLIERDNLPVLAVDPLSAADALGPEIVVDGRDGRRLARDTESRGGIRVGDVSLIIAATPGYAVGEDCDMAVVLQRGHDMGRPVTAPLGAVSVARSGGTSAAAPSGPDPVVAVEAGRGGGIFAAAVKIGAPVAAGDVIGSVDGEPLTAPEAGVVKGILGEGTAVEPGGLVAEIDLRGVEDYVYTISDQGRAVSGTVLEMAVSWAFDVGALSLAKPFVPFDRRP